MENKDLQSPNQNPKQELLKKILGNFSDVGDFLDGRSLKDKADLFDTLNTFILNYLGEHPIQTISPKGEPFGEGDNSFATFLRRAVLAFFKDQKTQPEIKKSCSMEVVLSNQFNKKTEIVHSQTLQQIPFLHTDTIIAIFTSLVKCVGKPNAPDVNNVITDTLFNDVRDGVLGHRQKDDNNEKDQRKQKVLPLDFVMAMVSKSYTNSIENIDKIYPFINMDPNDFINKNKKFLSQEIYSFLGKISLERVEEFLQDKNFVAALGGTLSLKQCLDIKTLETSKHEGAQKLARKLRDAVRKIDIDVDNVDGMTIVDDEDYKNKVKFRLRMHQFPEYLASVFILSFGIGLLFAAGFAWSVPLLLGIGFIITSIAAFVNLRLCMKPTEINTWLAKIFKNCAWIIDGALLITLGAVFCAGPLAIACIVFGSLGVLMGCFNAFVGTLNSMWDTQREMVDGDEAQSIDDIKSEILSHKIFTLVVFAVAFAAGVLLALNPAILPLALPFLPAIGIGIAVLSGLGLIKSALRLFYVDNSWQVGFYHAAKYIKAGMFVLGGLGLIALPFLPIATALASVIGMPTLVVNIFSFLVGLVSSIKGCMSVARMSSNIKFLLASQAMDYTYDNENVKLPLINDWKDDLRGKSPNKPTFKLGDISDKTLTKIFEEK